MKRKEVGIDGQGESICRQREELVNTEKRKQSGNTGDGQNRGTVVKWEEVGS